MSHRQLTKSCWLIACAVAATVSLHTALAATSLPAFSGQLTGEAPAPAEPLSLWYRQPGTAWTTALPVGNGKQGAMMFGGIDSEAVCLNETSLWSGGPYSPENPGLKEVLPQVREMLFNNQFTQAEQLLTRSGMGKPATEASFQPVGDLLLTFPKVTAAENYRRELNLRNATTSVSVTVDGVKYTRELWTSAPDNVIVMRLTADKPGKINFKMSFRTGQIINNSDGTDDTLIVSGSNRPFSGNGVNVPAALKFQTRAKILHEGGTLAKGTRQEAPASAPASAPATADAGGRGRGGRGGGAPAGTQIPGEYSLEGANSATILIASATSFKSFQDTSADPNALAAAIIDKASAKGYDAIRKDQLADHQKVFERVSLDLGPATDNSPTDQRIRNFPRSNDPGLAALYFQYGRFLLQGSSRAGGQPANLQGIWNSDLSPSWGSKFTININTEMNYWPVNNTNLGECIEPLLGMVEDLQVTGAKTAKAMYNANGWVAHHNTDLWRASAPIDFPASGYWPCGGAWLCDTLYDHYEFTQDKEFLKRLYPPMKGAAQFFLDTLIEDPKGRGLITSPSVSPEVGHAGGGSVAAGPTIDRQLVRDLFAHCIEAAQVLGVDPEFSAKLAETRKKIAPNAIGERGQLQEWLEDWDFKQGTDQKNRHISHLYGLYPGEDISYYNDKDLVAAVKVSLLNRGDNATGWGLGWRLNQWARLHDGEHAYTIVKLLLNSADGGGGGRGGGPRGGAPMTMPTTANGGGGGGFRGDSPPTTATTTSSGRGMGGMGGMGGGMGGGSGVYANLFDAHPPFQIDGNFGGTAGIAECLVQSVAPKTGKPALIELLPALPPLWADGKVTGLLARGNFTVDLTWKGGKVVEATIKNNGSAAASVNVLVGEKTQELKLAAGASQKVN